MEVIRALRPEDHPALLTLLAQLGYPVRPAELPARLQRFVDTGNGRVLVVEREGAVVAIAAWEVTHPIHHPAPVAHLSSFAVLEGNRRQGIGRRLLAAFEAAAHEQGCALAVLTSNIRRDDAHAFYPSAGYERIGLKFRKKIAP
jgi:GNAT superfamily N-acetyltransferase